MSEWGDEEPTTAYMSLGAYWQTMAYFNPGLKLPRKMKKRYLGTRRQRSKRLQFKMRYVEVNAVSRLVDIEVFNAGSRDATVQ